jgi:hypothetical protein
MIYASADWLDKVAMFGTTHKSVSRKTLHSTHTHTHTHTHTPWRQEESLMQDKNLWKRCIITNSIEQSPSWEAISRSACQEIPRLSSNPKVHYLIHNSLSLVPIQNQMHPVHTFPPYFPNIRSNIIFSPTPTFSERSLLFRSHACYMNQPSHPPSFDHCNKIWWSVQVKELLIMQSSPVSCHFLTLRSKYSPQYLISNIINLFSSLSVRNQVSHPYKTTGKTTV